MIKQKRCPKCGSKSIKEIFYGLPSPEFMESEKAKQYYFANRIETSNDPKWICLNEQCSYALSHKSRYMWGKN